MSLCEPIHPDELIGEVHAWEINPSLISSTELHCCCFDWLSAEERVAWERFSSAKLRHDYLAARALCRSSLSRYAPVKPHQWRFGRGAQGKPFISEPADFKELSFNLTHTRDLAVLVVGVVVDVGVDAEEISQPVDVSEIERHFLSAEDRAELAQLKGDARTARFFATWVRKEAYLKGCGTGLSRSPSSFTIPQCNPDGLCDYDGWQISMHKPSAKHVAAVAVRCGSGRMPIRWRGAQLPSQRGVVNPTTPVEERRMPHNIE
jgi:4'-phosphopantetheinyl transferase